MHKEISWRSILIGAVGMLMIMAAIALVVILTGSYNVAADERHTTPVEWALSTSMENSVRARAENVQPPPAFTSTMISAGGAEYKAMCQHCHGGVGAAKEEWVKGMRPQPPALASAAKEWQPAEIFWLVKHGVKATAMPSFGDTHEDATIWNIVAFVKAMPSMSAEQYAAYPAESGSHSEEGEGAAHSH